MSIGYGAAGRAGSRHGELGQMERAPDLSDFRDGVREPAPSPAPSVPNPKLPLPRGYEWEEQAGGERESL